MSLPAAAVNGASLSVRLLWWQCFSKVAPGRGKRSHITLRGWFGDGSTQVFVDEEVRRAVPRWASLRCRQ